MVDPETSSLARRLPRASALIFTGNFVAGVCVYALQVLMGRLLQVQDYSLFSALMGMFNIASLPLTALFMVVTRRLALWPELKDAKGAASLLVTAERRLGLALLVVFIAALATSFAVAGALGSDSPLPVMILWAAICLNAFVCLYAAALQGMHRFSQIAVGNAAIPALRILLCAALVALGLSVSGAMTGLLFSLLAGAAWYWWLTGRALARAGSRPTRGSLFTTREGLILATSSLGFIALTQLDYVIVRIACTPGQAGLYSAGAVLAKAVLWLPAGITVALYPTVVSENASNQPSAHLLHKSLGMAALFSGLLALTLAVGAGFWVRLLYGAEYAGAAPYLRWLSLIYLPMALVLVVDNYQLALGRARFIPLYFAGALAAWIAFAFPGATPTRLVVVLGAASVCCSVWALRIVLSDRGQSRLVSL
ncbi:MAG: hypothetical protein WC709_00830 [Thermoleophilia bacterium]